MAGRQGPAAGGRIPVGGAQKVAEGGREDGGDFLSVEAREHCFFDEGGRLRAEGQGGLEEGDAGANNKLVGVSLCRKDEVGKYLKLMIVMGKIIKRCA